MALQICWISSCKIDYRYVSYLRRIHRLSEKVSKRWQIPCFQKKKCHIEIFYIDMKGDDIVVTELPDYKQITKSENNIHGVIVTGWS